MKFKGCFISIFLFIIFWNENCHSEIPLVISTWNFVNATMAAWNVLDAGGSAIDAVVVGCNVCQIQQCDRTVGYGGSPDENGETTLDAMIMDGNNMNVGAVAGLRNIKNAIAVARYVLENTRHSFLVGDQASDFAKHMGFVQESLQTDESHKVWNDWNANDCQPNFWVNVVPDPTKSCGPYLPESHNDINYANWNDKIKFGQYNHDTIGMIIIDKNNHVIAGTSTNGAKHKIAGRVGDSPIIGSGAYADGEFGAAAATGDGDILMRFLPAYQSIENLRNGDDPNTAGEKALRRIIKYYENFMGAVIVATKYGKYGAACHGLQEFPYSVFNTTTNNVTVEYVKCFT